jgi:hypothetical protein
MQNTMFLQSLNVSVQAGQVFFKRGAKATGCVCEKIAQVVARPIFLQNFYRGKQ